MAPTPTTARLPIRAVPEADESLVGFLVRIAERNRFDSLRWLFRHVRIPFSSIELAATTPFDLAPLASASGADPVTLIRMAYWPVGQRKVSFLGHVIRREMVTVRYRRACPRCLSEAPFHRAVWDLKFATICIRHAVRLIDQCTECRRPIGWSHRGLITCQCGTDLRKAQVRPVAQEDFNGEAYVHDQLGLSSCTKRDQESHVAMSASLAQSDALSRLVHRSRLAADASAQNRPQQPARPRATDLDGPSDQISMS